MENNIPIHLQEIIFATSDIALNRQLSQLEAEGQIKKIAPRIYTSNFDESEEIIIRRNIFTILGKLYPGAVLSHRSALEFKPTTANQIFVTYTYTKKIELPGITIRFMEGLPAIEGDNPFSGELFVSQQERALLENLQSSRQVGPTSKTITLPEIETKLEQIVQVKGEEGLNQLRDKAREIADKLKMQSEFEKLNKLVSALLTTKPSKILTSPLAVARALGNPYDKHRLELFEKLFVELQQQPYKERQDINAAVNSFRNFAFFEAYFSNYIEGTIFEIEEAKSIIQTETPIPNRDEDSHDILGTYKLVSNLKEMSTTPSNPDELLNILQYRHQILLGARTSKKPGQFKEKNNRAGETHFVDHTLVRGTLIKGFDYYQALQEPFAKAAYIMFMISEIHPFLDGNGRIARVMMNAELVKVNQTRIIIPTVYRDDYLGALRRLTRNDDPTAYIRMLQRAQEFSATLIANNIDELESHLTLSNAFKEHDEAKLKIIDPIS
ncbi:Fic/DOC family protein [Flavobacterium fryxellicola]|uniref:Cell filamentation protein Fic n=1 Tax=Flavobacterium fryxellicola TaxID=249352 RepID=A0A167ZL64_9FLAO|nr:Fic family protein [Flavobacterium fryxellicola]OAB30567.1 cell filamentation protein Fic [Flavobacterium fryxellicola]SHN77055.1 Fic/DOC family protein [Flavobacterium fryxellicola]